MKRAIVLMTMLLMAIVLSAQTVTAFRVTEISRIPINGTELGKQTSTRTNPQYLCIYDPSVGSVKFQNKAQTAYYLDLPATSKKTDYDEDGDLRIRTEYYSTDEDGIECTLILYEYPEIRMFYFTAIYVNVSISFIMEKL